MTHPQIIILECFSNLSPGKLLIYVEQLDDLSQFKFDSEGDTSIIENASIFLKFCEYYEIDYEDVWSMWLQKCLKLVVAWKYLKNKCPHIEVKRGPNHSTHCPDSNGVNDAQIWVCMLQIFTVKV